MSDLIDRQAAIDALRKLRSEDAERGIVMDDLISRKQAIDVASGYCHPANIADELTNLPSAQPEIIRCKDCRYAKMTHTGECKYCTYLADNFGIDDAVYFEGNDYCSHAERKTDGSD